MKNQLFAAIAAVTLSGGAALAQGATEPAYMCVPTAGGGDAQGVPNIGAWCPTPEHYVIEQENRALARLQDLQRSLATTVVPATQPHG
ncbi:MAG TPA: hypothetical protein VLI93_04160 [Acetobacteraceae bacterium]|nr:hypothetical protein [Acetobacteraceae bacterium]